jgi:hypothetical protein
MEEMGYVPRTSAADGAGGSPRSFPIDGRPSLEPRNPVLTWYSTNRFLQRHVSVAATLTVPSEGIDLVPDALYLTLAGLHSI